MKTGILQLNLTIGDFTANASRLIQECQRLDAQGVDLIVSSELALSGYYPWDLLEAPGFLAQQDIALSSVVSASRSMEALIVLGAITSHPGPGKKLRNSALVIHKGQIIHQAHKQLLPTYNIFDERRHFEPGTETLVFSWNQRQLALLICEDAWNTSGDLYAADPVLEAVKQGAQTIITINASPWHSGKPIQRLNRFGELARQYQVDWLYVNQVGGHDELLFDGSSFALNSSGHPLFLAPLGQESTAIVDIGSSSSLSPSPDWPSGDAERFDMLVLGLRDYARRCGFSTAVVGSSGGIDSAVVLALAQEAFGSSAVTAITMPGPYSSSGSHEDSQILCDNLGVPLLRLSISPFFQQINQSLETTFGTPVLGLAQENLQARLRGVALMAHSNQTGSLLLSTGNKSELSVGYCTLYGDMNGGLNPLGDLYKTEVYSLARYINLRSGRELIPESIISKEPSAELAPGQRDQDSLPPYPALDAFLKLFLESDHLGADEKLRLTRTLSDYRLQAGSAQLERLPRMIQRAEFKRWQACPILRIHPLAFGSGRKLPIAHAFDLRSSFQGTVD